MDLSERKRVITALADYLVGLPERDADGALSSSHIGVTPSGWADWDRDRKHRAIRSLLASTSEDNYSRLIDWARLMGDELPDVSDLATATERTKRVSEAPSTAPGFTSSRPPSIAVKEDPSLPSRPSLFVGSSAEGLSVARALQAELEFDVEATIWSQGVFGLSDGTLESLAAKAPTFEFAVLVLTPDDLLTSREKTSNAPRDNVIFEAGLFMGALGRRRVFMVSCRDDQLALPSDFAGISMAQYNRRSDGNLQAAVGPVATNIRTAIKAALAGSDAPTGDQDGHAGADDETQVEGEAAGPALEQLTPSPASQSDPQDDLYELLNAIDQLISLLESKDGPLRGDIAKLYSVILARVKAARPTNPFVSTLSAPQETAMSGIYKTTIGEAVAGLSLMRSALLSAS
jgi:hypothetical protein